MPDLLMKRVPESLGFAPLSNVVLNKHSWTVALDGDSGYHVTFADKPSSPVDMVSSSDEMLSSLGDFDLSGEHEIDVTAEVSDAMSTMAEEQLCKVSVQSQPRKCGRPRKSTTLSPVKVIKKRDNARKVQTPIVQPENRCLTRSCLNTHGFNSHVNYAERSVRKKIPRAKMLLVQVDNVQKEGAHLEKEGATNESEDIQYPATPIRLMQHVGVQLSIDPAKLTTERLEADPKDTSLESNDD
jgi:hypothetical protein